MIESALVSCEWVEQHLDAENQIILDATFFLPRQNRNAQAEYLHQHLPGALFFDIDEVADLSSSMSHMLPNAEHFSDVVGKVGISNDTRVLIYDNNHFFAAARVWWMFRVFGHEQVQVIDGGLARWKQLKLPVCTEQTSPISKIYKAQFQPELVFDLKQMLEVQKSKLRQIIDARSAGSFVGQGQVVDRVLKSGHIPGSINIPYANLTESSEQTLLENPTLQLLFEQANVNLSGSIVTTCGTGVSACVLALALYKIGLKDIPVYDGSWAEWGRQEETPKLIKD